MMTSYLWQDVTSLRQADAATSSRLVDSAVIDQNTVLRRPVVTSAMASFSHFHFYSLVRFSTRLALPNNMIYVLRYYIVAVSLGYYTSFIVIQVQYSIPNCLPIMVLNIECILPSCYTCHCTKRSLFTTDMAWQILHQRSLIQNRIGWTTIVLNVSYSISNWVYRYCTQCSISTICISDALFSSIIEQSYQRMLDTILYTALNKT